MDILGDVTTIMKKVFKNQDIVVTHKTVAGDIEKWTSISHTPAKPSDGLMFTETGWHAKSPPMSFAHIWNDLIPAAVGVPDRMPFRLRLKPNGWKPAPEPR